MHVIEQNTDVQAVDFPRLGAAVGRRAGFLAPAGYPSRSCPHLVPGFPRSQLVYCLSEEVRSRTGGSEPALNQSKADFDRI